MRLNRELSGHTCVTPAVTGIIGSGKDSRVGELGETPDGIERVLKWNPESRWGG